jgi:hypothetical protein
MRLLVLLVLVGLWAPTSSAGAAKSVSDLGKTSGLSRFVSRSENAWKRRDWRALSSATANEVHYTTSDDIDDDFTFKGKDRLAFFKNFLLRMRIDRRAGGGAWQYLGRWKPVEREFWGKSFTRPWKAQIIWFKRGSGAKDRSYDVKVALGYASILLVKESGYWRIWGFDRNSA